MKPVFWWHHVKNQRVAEFVTLFFSSQIPPQKNASKSIVVSTKMSTANKMSITVSIMYYKWKHPLMTNTH